MSIFKKIKKFYAKSDENKIQLAEMIGIGVIPPLVLAILYIVFILISKGHTTYT